MNIERHKHFDLLIIPRENQTLPDNSSTCQLPSTSMNENTVRDAYPLFFDPSNPFHSNPKRYTSSNTSKWTDVIVQKSTTTRQDSFNEKKETSVKNDNSSIKYRNTCFLVDMEIRKKLLNILHNLKKEKQYYNDAKKQFVRKKSTCVDNNEKDHDVFNLITSDTLSWEEKLVSVEDIMKNGIKLTVKCLNRINQKTQQCKCLVAWKHNLLVSTFNKFHDPNKIQNYHITCQQKKNFFIETFNCMQNNPGLRVEEAINITAKSMIRSLCQFELTDERLICELYKTYI